MLPHEGDEVREQLIGSAVPDRLERLQRRPVVVTEYSTKLSADLRGHGTQRSEETDSHGVGRRRPVEVRRPAQQRHFECLELGSRQVLELVGADAVEHVDERTEDETCLGVARASRQHAQPRGARLVDACLPERRLADAGPAGEDERGVTVPGQEGTEGGELALPAADPGDRRSPAGRAQRRSTTAAIAWPWPMHIDATP